MGPIFLAAAFAVGLGLTVAGRRGRRTDDHPLCRRCRFDLTGRPADAERRCPECGAGLGPPRAVVVGHRRRRPVVLAGGLLVVALSVWAGAVAELDRASNRSWLVHAPLWYVLHEAGAADVGRREPATAEVRRRYDAGTLSAADCPAVADVALAAQADATKPWDRTWGDMLEGFQSNGRLSPDRWARYARQALPGLLRLRVRKAVRRGDPLPFTVGIDPDARVANESKLSAGLRWVSITCPDAPTFHHDFQQTAYGYVDVVSGSPSGHPSLPPAAIASLPADGAAHELVFTADVQLGTSDPTVSNYSPEGRHMVASGPVSATRLVVLLPADQPTAVAVPDPSLTDAVRRSVGVSIQRPVDAGGQPDTVLEVDVGHAPVDLAFDVLARIAGREVRLGSAYNFHERSYGFTFEFRLPPDVAPGRSIDTVFRSNPDQASGTMGVTQVWGGSFEVTGVRCP